jgi:CheY-like chemotaxis protein
MAVSRSVLALASRTHGGRQAALTEEVERAGLALHVVADLSQLIRQLDVHPRALLLDVASPDAESACRLARTRMRDADTIVIVLCRRLTDVAYARALSWGADDVTAIEPRGALSSRLSALPETPPAPPDPRGPALVLDRDAAHAAVVGRVLVNAGYDVTFASDPSSLEALAEDQLVVQSAEVGSAGQLLWRARRAGHRGPWLVSASPGELESTRAELVGETRTAVVDRFAPTECILFLANELVAGFARDNRAETRFIYGTIVGFRAVGAEHDDHAFTYNVSGGGMYIRSLAPPPANTLWLEVRPPSTTPRVRLLAEVAWRRSAGSSAAATAPPGFGLKLLEGLGDGMENWKRGVRIWVAQSRAAARWPRA